MATCAGIFGAVSGRLGPFVYSTWKGRQVIKMSNKKSNASPGKKQVEQREKFRVISKFTGSLSSLFAQTFKDSRKMTSLNMAFRYNYRNALTGSVGEYKIDYAKVMISLGDLHPSGNTVAEVMDYNVKFSWKRNSDHAGTNPDDKTILVIHCPEMQQSIYRSGGADRSSGSDSIDASIFSGKTVETWMAFECAQGKTFSWSKYTGQFVIR